MNTSGLLDQLLKAGQKALQNNGGSTNSGTTGNGAQTGGGGLGDLLGSVFGGDKPGSFKPGSSASPGNTAGSSGSGGVLGGLGDLLNGADKSTIATGAGLLGLLLGNKGLGKGGLNKAVAYGGLAVLGMQAYKAYTAWQEKQSAAASASTNETTPSRAMEPQTVDRVPAAQAEQHSRAILRAIIAAAKADGRVDEHERQMIQDELGKLGHDPELQRWLETELDKPLDPTEVASAADTPEMAAEMYLASKLLIDESQYMQRVYLEELARQLKIEPGLKSELDEAHKA